MLVEQKQVKEEIEDKEELLKAKEKSSTNNVLKWISQNFKFLLIPASRLDELTLRQADYEKLKSKRNFSRLFKSPLTVVGLTIIFCFVSLAIFGHWISPYTFEEANGVFPGTYNPPSPNHLFGTMMLGRDVLARMIFGTYSSLTIALPSVVISVVLGVSIGTFSAYSGGWIDSVIMRIMDIFLAFPGLILAMVLIQLWGQRIEIIMTVWGFMGVPFYARLIRGSVLQAKNLPYVDAAKTVGASKFRIMFRHILPNCIQPIIVSFTFDIGSAVLNLAALAFLGFYDPNMIEWGHDISYNRIFLYNAPWASLGPGFMIVIYVLGFMLIGDGIRDYIDPKLKNL
ncbi:MAG: ABC transporter permease [Candidatus Hermodarchaeota archaeon]